MHLSSGKSRRRLVDEINITPLTDVFLVLLIIMMVVAPMMKTTQKIKPPTVDGGGSPITSVRLIVEVTSDGRYFIDGDPVTVEALPETLRIKGASYTEKDVILQADGKARAHAVIQLFNAARDAEFEKMTLSVEDLSAQRAQELEKTGNEIPGVPVS